MARRLLALIAQIVWIAAVGMALIGAAESAARAKIVLKSGKTIEGTIIERTADHVRVREFDGVSLNYDFTEITRIDESKESSPEQTPVTATTQATDPVAQPAASDGSSPTVARALPVEDKPITRAETAIITYRIGGSLPGTETAYIDGERLAVEEHRTGSESVDLDIDDGQWYWQVLLTPGWRPSGGRSRTFGWPGAIRYFEDWMSGSQYQPGEWQGKPVHVYSTAGYDGLFYRGLVVSSRYQSLGREVTQEATDIQLDVPIPAEKFLPPEDLKLRDGGELPSDQERGYGEAIQRNLKSLQTDPAYGDFIRQTTREDGQVDVLVLRKLLRTRGKLLPRI